MNDVYDGETSVDFGNAVKSVTSGVGRQLVDVAIRLGIGEFLNGTALNYADLSEVTDSNPGAMRRFMRGLANFGLCIERSDGNFELTPRGSHLLTDSHHERDSTRRMSSEDSRKSSEMLLYSLKSGKPAFNRLYGVDFFEYMKGNSEARARFDGFMALETTETAKAILEAYDFTGVRSIIDLGGGYGALIVSILRSNPHLIGTLFDAEEVISQAMAYLNSAGIGDRCRTVSGDFFSSVPAGSDVYILSQILHDWSDEQCERILLTCRSAMHDSSRVLAIEVILPEHVDQESVGVDLDIMMLMMTGGRQRTEAEFESLLSRTGFALKRVSLLANTVYSLLEATPIRER